MPSPRFSVTEDINKPRILNLKERTLIYKFRFKYPTKELIPTPPPQYLFQQVMADLFHLDGNLYIAYADRMTGWMEVEHISEEAFISCLIIAFCQWFRRLGIPEELSCDGGTNFTSHVSRSFFSTWCVKLRISSAHYTQSKWRAEAAIKSTKRLLRGNISRGGSLDTDAITSALMQYLNTPLQRSDTSPYVKGNMP
ncbi:uncharacterized protein LOC119596682 [Penaeus monodon]|uniref:uncharacterized protein LOC119596682 n=1 Tax=Penaeus monodon TaxID=6687 RepID=UPI0018A724AA|nr:uncharacterized protein LOC119596682 [Penaeus monodon]